jgi:diphthamide synthase (EF-2-diphthine--ammonia ligase)
VGEGGEYEKLALHAPNFVKRIRIAKAKKIWKRKG